jgi:hypothetical protein
MKISELIERLGAMQGMFGDIPVLICVEDPQHKGMSFVRLEEMFVQYDICNITNMSAADIANLEVDVPPDTVIDAHKDDS